MLENFWIQLSPLDVDLISPNRHPRPPFTGTSICICLSSMCLPSLRACISRPHNSFSLLDCPSSMPQLPRVVDPLGACPSLPWPPRALLAYPVCLLPRVCIWSMKEFCNLNCDARDVLKNSFIDQTNLFQNGARFEKPTVTLNRSINYPLLRQPLVVNSFVYFFQTVTKSYCFSRLLWTTSNRHRLSSRQGYHYFRMFQFGFWSEHCMTIYL